MVVIIWTKCVFESLVEFLCSLSVRTVRVYLWKLQRHVSEENVHGIYRVRLYQY